MKHGYFIDRKNANLEDCIDALAALNFILILAHNPSVLIDKPINNKDLLYETIHEIYKIMERRSMFNSFDHVWINSLTEEKCSQIMVAPVNTNEKRMGYLSELIFSTL